MGRSGTGHVGGGGKKTDPPPAWVVLGWRNKGFKFVSQYDSAQALPLSGSAPPQIWRKYEQSGTGSTNTEAAQPCQAPNQAAGASDG